MTSVGGASSAAVSTSIWSAKAGRSKSTTGPDALGKDDFMKLLLAQLQHQDPLKPMDDQQFVAQVAQFNALEQMQSVNKTLTAVLDAQRLTEASGLIGKTVEATGSDGKAITGAVTGVSVVKGMTKLHLGEKIVDLDKVTKVASDVSSLPADPPKAAGAGV